MCHNKITMKTLISCKCCFSGPLFSRPGQLQWEATSRLNRDKLISVVQGCTVGVYWSLKWPLFARHDWTCNTPFFVRPYWWDVWWFGSVSKVCGIPLITISTRFKQRGAMWREMLLWMQKKDEFELVFFINIQRHKRQRDHKKSSVDSR